MSYLLIKNGNVIADEKILKSDVLIKDNLILDIDFSGELPKDCKVIDAKDKYVSPGFIDIHLHGGGGYDFMDCTTEAFCEISKTHLLNGTTTMIPTAVSSTFENIINFIKTYKASAKLCPNFFGIHLEGPYISKNQKGAHKEQFLHSPTNEEIDILIKEGKGVIKRITAAPELDNMKYFAKKMLENGVSLNIGHSDATSDIALDAFGYGFSHITHLYSVTPSVRKINQTVKAGVVEAAYLDDNVTVELIADGSHAAVDALRLAVKIKGTDKVALITDALRPAGTDVKESYLGEKVPENRVIIEDGVAKLPDRSFFAGSIATTAMLLERGVNHYGLSLADTVKMITKTPAKIMGIKNKGEIKNSYIADIVIFDKNYKINNVILNGNVIK
ncbi:MAG: N-acetylglucosamine-6-phosphate deacetylase [Clostridia bacterium]|nr:N-acetylglucosamine-6-phosphate deacetylase [Clostridia bacterium]